jgi:hypothetical protein
LTELAVGIKDAADSTSNMKASSILFALSLVFSLAVSTASAKDFKFPQKGDTLFTISIPDGWSPEYDDEGTLEGEDKDGHSYFAVWEEDTDTELTSVANDIDDILKEYAKDVKAGKPEQMTLAGMPALLFKGTAKDKDDGSGIGFEAMVVVVKGKKAAVIYYDYSEDAPDAVVKQLVKILESVKPAK